MDYEQDDHDWLQEIFGCQNEEAAVQVLGAVNTREGRLLTSPIFCKTKSSHSHLLTARNRATARS